MGTISRSAKTGGGTDLNDGEVAPVADINTDMNTIFDDHNGEIINVNIKAAAEIAPTKIDDYQGAGEITDHNDPAGAAPTNMAEEIAELRYTIRQIKSGTTGNWYDDPDQTIWDIARGYIDGYQMTDANANDVSIGAGACKDSANTQWLSGGAMIKETDATWEEGTTNGGMNDGEAAANDTWYHVFAIKVPGVGGDVDYGFDTELDARNLIADAAVLVWSSDVTPYYRRIGSILLAADGPPRTVVAFTQLGDWFTWDTPPQDIDVAAVSVVVGAPDSLTLSVPPDVKVQAQVNVSVTDDGSEQVRLYSPDEANALPTATNGIASISAVTDEVTAGQFIVKTDTSKVIRSVASAGSSVTMDGVTVGWIDQRGKNA